MIGDVFACAQLNSQSNLNGRPIYMYFAILRRASGAAFAAFARRGHNRKRANGGREKRRKEERGIFVSGGRNGLAQAGKRSGRRSGRRNGLTVRG